MAAESYKNQKMIDAKTLRLVTRSGLQAFASGHVLDGIAALQTLLPYCSREDIVRADAESLEKNYHYMLSFLRDGGHDEKRGEVLAKLRKKGVSLLEKACRAIRLSIDDDRYAKALHRLEENYDTPIRTAVIEKWNSLLTPEETSSTQDDLFDLLWTSPLWSPQDTALWFDFLSGQQDMVQQHLSGAVFLSLWEHYDAEKMQLLALLADSSCHRTRLAAACYLLLLRLRHAEIDALMPPLPDSMLSRKGRHIISQVQYELLLMLVSEKDMEHELKEAEELSRSLLSPGKTLNLGGIKDLISLKGRYLRNRLKRGLDINLAKVPLLHSSEYMHRISHWFLPFDKNHPLFQSVLIDEQGNEKRHLSALLDLIVDCDVDKLATLYLAASDKDFSKAVQQLDTSELPDVTGAVVPEYSLRYIVQDLYRFFLHSLLVPFAVNPFRMKLTLFDFPELFRLIPADDVVKECELLYELGRDNQVMSALDELMKRKGATASALLLKAKALRRQKKLSEAIGQARSAEMLEPDNTEVLRFLIECHALQKRYDEELEYLQRLVELMPDEVRLRRLMPFTMARAGKKEEALRLFFELDYESDDAGDEYRQLVAGIADTALALGKTDVAGRYTEKELTLDGKERWKALLRLGHVRLIEGNLHDSIASYEQALGCLREQGKEAKMALAAFDESRELLLSQGISTDDFLLVRDIMQAAADKMPLL